MGFCIRCKSTWTGLNRAHCTGCHRTFNSVAAFDKHRRDSKCLDPETLGMKMDDKGIWAGRMSEELKNSLRAIRSEPLRHLRGSQGKTLSTPSKRRKS